MIEAPTINALEFMDMHEVFQSESWKTWHTSLSAIFGLPIADMELFTQCTERTEPPPGQIREFWGIMGRRSGKSIVAAHIAIYMACFREWHVAPGETPMVMIVAADRRQAFVVKRYISGLMNSIPQLKAQIQNEKRDRITLYNGIELAIFTSDFKTIRGWTVVCAIFDEVAFWPTDEKYRNPDIEIYTSVEAGMATQPGSILIGISSPHARRGILYQRYKEYFGKNDPEILVWKAPTLVMNPTVPTSTIKRAYTRDPARAAAEYGAEFRSDIESYISQEMLDPLIPPGVTVNRPNNTIHYTAFVDPSGGSQDAMTLAISHREKDVGILDCVVERIPPFSPESVVREFTQTLKNYHVRKVTGDRYGGEFCREPFRRYNIRYDLSPKSRSDLYRDLLPLMNSGRIQLLDNTRLIAQFVSLERRVARGGRDSIDHAPGAHDDLANAAAGALVLQEKRQHGIVWGR